MLLRNEDRWLLVEEDSPLSISEQCRVLALSRSTYYWKKSHCDDEDERRKKKETHDRYCDTVLREWTLFPSYGYRKMGYHLRSKGNEWATEHAVRKIYKELGLKGVTPVFRTTRPSSKGVQKFPYLLRNRSIRYVNEAWATDITYMKLSDRMVYFTAIIDLRSRKILSYRLCESMDAGFCLDALMEAIENYGVPAIFNTDQGSQYTSKEFISILKSYGIQISMDGVGRCKDNIIVERIWRTLKYEWVFLKDYRDFDEMERGMDEFVHYFNSLRLHQGLEYKTPDEVYWEGTFPKTVTKTEDIA